MEIAPQATVLDNWPVGFGSPEVDEQPDGRHFAQVLQVPGARAYGVTAGEAMTRAQAMALRLLADQIEHGAHIPNLVALNFRATVDPEPSREPRASRRRFVAGVTAAFVGLGVFVIGGTQWWISTVLAAESGRSFADSFSARPQSFLALWGSVLGMFLVLGLLTGLVGAYLRDRLERPMA